MHKQATILPQPNPDALKHSEKVEHHLCNLLSKQGGKIPFHDFMHEVLYAPGLGYYSAGLQEFGKNGDFITAPEISPLFSRCIAQQCRHLLASLENGSIIEFGAGSGTMAADILLALQQSNALPQHYYILEVSANLRAKQESTLLKKCPTLKSRVIWLNELPKNFSGIVLANEVLDAMPIRLVHLSKERLQEYHITYQNNEWQLVLDEPTHNATLTTMQHIATLLEPENLTQGYTTEINNYYQPWLQSLADCLDKGLVLFIDYGFPQHEYYHPQRHQGTLMCHYRHHAHDNPLIHLGLQDITAHVNFTAVAEAAISTGFLVSGYTTQAMFLLANGIADNAPEIADPVERYNSNQALMQLTSPQEMGELFKVMALSKNIDITPSGFERVDIRHKL